MSYVLANREADYILQFLEYEYPDPEGVVQRPRIWIRQDSQDKIKYGGPGFVETDISRLTLDIVRVSRPKLPGHLSKETLSCLGMVTHFLDGSKVSIFSIALIFLAFGGVTYATFKELYKESLEDLFKKLADWDGPNALPKLWLAVFESDHVLMDRLRREAGGAARALGFASGYVEDPSEFSVPSTGSSSGESSDEDDALSEASVTMAPEGPFPGMNKGFAEQILFFLAAGFSPRTTPILKQKLEGLIKGVLTKFLGKLHVAIPLSLEGLAVPGTCFSRWSQIRYMLMCILLWSDPDPCNVLKEGEIFYQSSEGWETKEGNCATFLMGHALVCVTPWTCVAMSSSRRTSHLGDSPSLQGSVRCPTSEWARISLFLIKYSHFFSPPSSQPSTSRNSTLTKMSSSFQPKAPAQR